MSSLDHDRLLEERPTAPRTAARTGTETEVPKPRRTRRSSPEKAEAERSRTTVPTTSRTKRTAAKPTATEAAPAATIPAQQTTAAASPKAATPKPAAAKAAASKAAAAEAPAAKKAAAKKAPAKKAPAKAAAKPVAKKAVAKKPAAEKAAAPRVATAAQATAAERPTPTKRPAPAAIPAPATATATTAATATESAPAPSAVADREVRAAGVRAAVRSRFRFGSAPRRRPAILLAAALVGALSIGLFSAANDRAVASAGSRPVSVAHALGLTSRQSSAPSDAADELRMVTASRAQRQAEETAAAQAQAAADQAAIEAARPKAVLPVDGAVLTTCFCMRWGTMHWGIDLAAPMGTPEYAAMDGVVVKAGPASGFGQAVYIQHANGDVTVYGHMEKILVTTGQVVHAGDTIALLGAEGEATGPHLHFEVHAGGLEGPKIDPIPWLRERGVQI